MTADIEMLPLPCAMAQLGHAALQAWGYEQMRAYARAVAEHNVKARDAEIEALRAELAASKSRAEQAEARAERLEEALRELVEVFIESGMYDVEEEVFAKARDAIAAKQEENDNG